MEWNELGKWIEMAMCLSLVYGMESYVYGFCLIGSVSIGIGIGIGIGSLRFDITTTTTMSNTMIFFNFFLSFCSQVSHSI